MSLYHKYDDRYVFMFLLPTILTLNGTHFYYNIRVQSHKYARLSVEDQIICKPVVYKLKIGPCPFTTGLTVLTYKR